MTKGGQSHPVWWDDQTTWRVWLGGNIQGEVRVRCYPKTTTTSTTQPQTNLQPGSKLQRLTDSARAYNCDMNIYGNNCRIFCARMEREVKRLNAENSMLEDDPSINDHNGLIASCTQKVATAKQKVLSSDYVADGLMIWRIIGVILLPALYPLVILCACWDSIL